MEELFTRFWNDLAARVHGPLKLRFVLQPLMATIMAIRTGLQDARDGHPPYLWTILMDKSERRALLLKRLAADMRVLFLAILIDAIYQLLVLQQIYPLEMLTVGLVLAVLPYVLLRGPVNRMATIWRDKRSRKAQMIG
jgi:hypothetical protein